MATRYAPEVREAAVHRVRSGEAPRQVCAELGMSADTLRRWVRAAAQDDGPAVEGAPAANGPAAVLPARLSTAYVAAEPETARRPVATRAMPDDIFPRAEHLLPRRLRVPLVAVALAVAVLLSALLSPGEGLHSAALLVHLVSLVVGFGAVLVVDWHGLLWLAGRRRLLETMRLAAAVGPLIWLGLGGLVASGTLLEPDLGTGRTWVKLGLVLLVALNGIAAGAARRSLAALPAEPPPGTLPWAHFQRVMVLTTTSQIGWWGAVIIGFLTSAGRR